MSDDFAQRILRLFETVHPLDRVQRAGYVLRGVAQPESVAAHSHGVALLALLVCDACPGRFDRARALGMAIVHDLPEAQLMDIPMPAADAHLKQAKRDAEFAVAMEMFAGFPPHYVEWQRELEAADSPEARLIRGLDKAQMMLKVWMYERDGWQRAEEFWSYPGNFRDFGVPEVSAIFDAVCAAAGRTRPGA